MTTDRALDILAMSEQACWDNGIDSIDVDKAVETIRKALEQKPCWIPVSEQLPEEVGTYITTADYGKYGLAVGQRYYHGKGIGWEDDCIIAWMPLPEPYKANNEEKS